MKQPKVSLIIPCYNSGKYIGRLLDSVIAQDYSNLDLILVNDGSTDDTHEVIQQYAHVLNENKINLIYKRQENLGIGAATDNALKLFDSDCDYLCWCDSDDYFEPGSLVERVNFLESHPEYSIVASDAYCRNAENLNNFTLLAHGHPEKTDPEQFIALFTDRGFCCSGCFMVRTSAFLSVNPQRSIYRSRFGQNWQLLLPICYRFKRAFLDKPLYNYVIYPRSHSHGDSTWQEKIARIDGYEDIVNQTLKMIEETQKVDLAEYYRIAGAHFLRKRIGVYCECRCWKDCYNALKLKRSLYGFTGDDCVWMAKKLRIWSLRFISSCFKKVKKNLCKKNVV